MPVSLTSKQNAFAMSLADGLPASDSYRQAYDADGMQPESVWVEACRLATNPKVALRVQELREEQEEERADFITPLGSAPLSGVRPYRVLTNEQGEAFELTSSPDAGGSQHEYVSLTDWIEFASKSI